MIVIAVANVPAPDKSAAKKLLLVVTTAVAEWLGVWCTEQRIASLNPALLTDLFFFPFLKNFLGGPFTYTKFLVPVCQPQPIIITLRVCTRGKAICFCLGFV